MGTKLDLKNKVFGRLTVVRQEGKTANGNIRWGCRCECGNHSVVLLGNLRSGHTKSCGCLNEEVVKNNLTKHGCGSKGHESPEYIVWLHFKGRCYNKKNKAYSRYGGRGIKVCDRWLESFENFYEDMGDRPSLNHSLDRFPNNDGDYYKENCRWATMEEQSRNKRNNRWFNHNNEMLVMADWAKKFGIRNCKLWTLLKKNTFVDVYNLYMNKSKQ